MTEKKPEPLKGKELIAKSRRKYKKKNGEIVYHTYMVKRGNFAKKDIRSAAEWANKKVHEFSFERGLYKGHIDKGAVYEIIKKAFEDVMKDD